MNLRQKLQVHWASYKKIFKYQPINSIKRYFGEKVAIYFAWLGMYTTFLFPVAIFGLICFVYGIYVATNDVIVHEVCSAGTNVNTSIILCPLCHRMCDYQFLQRKCFYTKLSRFFDNGSAIVFAIFVSIWATVFLEFWKRKQISLAYQWHTLEYEDDEELPRPKFNIRAKKYTRKSPVTNELEHYMPKIQTRVRLSVSISIVFILCCILVICYFFIGNLGSYAFKKLSESSNETIKYNASIIKVVITGFLNLIVILAFQSQYPTAAKRLTEWENPKTETDFEDSYITKMFWFNFVNNFCPLIFIAFVERNYLPWKDYGLIKPERCSMQGCFVDLSIQLIIIMIGKQFIGNIQEILIPYLKTKWQKRANAVQYNISDHTLKPQWILDYNCLPHGQHALLNQYLEIVLQFCYVTMFVAAFPLAPLFALINNLIEIRLDATSHIRLFRRPIPRKVQDIGAWFDILNVISKISILVSGFLIAFTSEWIPRTVYKYRYSPNGSYKGYTEFSLSYFNIKDFTDDEKPIASSISQTFCRYPGYYKDKEPYSETLDYWIIFGARFAFIVSFQVLGLSISSIIAYMVPDVPEELKIMKKKEKFLEQQRREDTSGTIFNS